MMESTKLKLLSLSNGRLIINIILGVLILFLLNSCQKDIQVGMLECILESIDADKEGIDIFVGQTNGWTDSTTLISIMYHKKSIEIAISSNLKGLYKGCDIFFYQTNLDTMDNKIYKQIPNNINWTDFKQKIVEDNMIVPPYEPVVVQVEYNIKRSCISNIIKGDGYITSSIISKCHCEDNE